MIGVPTSTSHTFVAAGLRDQQDDLRDGAGGPHPPGVGKRVSLLPWVKA